ncbi:MAG: aminotransferase class I/II-fold pyridoxal phosphate-dependent enzyme [Clostridia bacterium]|jgi:threonine-phosphate decarboxylase|nr:aminotransferase class I/II-fold pyridoxal phosphate-dependent enzyme [Clostridia bacterium]
MENMEDLRHKHGGDIYSYKNVCDFSANINPLGIPENVKKAIIEEIENCVHYPDPKCRKLKEAVSKKEGFGSEEIICTNGAAELIFAVCFAYRPKKALLMAPCFAEYEKALSACGCNIERYFLDENKDFIAGMDFIDKINDGTDIVFFTNPNNPVGNTYSFEFIKGLYSRCLKTHTVLIVDECFNDFLDNGESVSIKNLLNENDNVLIIKAFTKFYAIPGIRLGYGLCRNKKIINKISSCLQTWNVSNLAQKAGEHSFDDKEFESKTKKYISNEKKYLISNLEKLDVKIIGKDANYIFFKEKENFGEKMLKEGFLIRDCRNYIGLKEGFYRIAIRRHDENMNLIKAWTKIRKEG